MGSDNDQQLIYCYNKGCGKKFNPDENNEGSCTYHPGPPYFHDANKIWKCCGKKSTDFSTWLGFKGCTKGKHCGDKPVQTEAPKSVPIKEIRSENPSEQMVSWSGLNKPAERSPKGKLREFSALTIEVGINAKRSLEKFGALKLDHGPKPELGGETVSVGGTCKNSTCKEIYTGSGYTAKEDECIYHPGIAVFHEGMKYWSCCNKKTSDFRIFLDQIGCTKGRHCWSKSKERDEKLREDWFQRMGLVHINIYCKGTLPNQSFFESDGLNLNAHITYDYGGSKKRIDYSLFGEILPLDSKVIINERKVEIILKQVGVQDWPKLSYDGGTGAFAIDDDDEGGAFLVEDDTDNDE